MGTVTQPDCHQDAADLLRRNGQTVTRVVAVDVDSVLYIDRYEKPRTAWLRRLGTGGLVVRSEPGFCADRGVSFPGEPA